MNSKLEEQHDAYGMIGAYRTSHSPPGAVVFDSDVLHHHTMRIQLSRAVRVRELNRDWVYERGPRLIEIVMSEAQWAAFVSSVNTSGVPCTIHSVDGKDMPRIDFAPRLEHSLRETREAAHRAFAEIIEALRVYEETPSTPAKAKKEAFATLRAKINNAVPNVEYAGESLAEHAENVVEKARADIETMVVLHSQKLGLEPGNHPTLALGRGTTPTEDA